MIRFACDVHTHTLFSRHAYSTLEEDVRAAAAKNLELLGITDHFSCMLFDQQTLKNFQYFINIAFGRRNGWAFACSTDVRPISSTSRGICSAGISR